MKRLLLLLLAALLPSLALQAGTCSPTSASITYEADDRLFFYLNGHQVVDGTFNDAGAPPQTVSINPAWFNVGSGNYFAAEILNNAASLVGGGWVISINCADGSLSYITNTDNTFDMYDDTTGSAPPPANWFDPLFTDPGALFVQTPVQTAAFGWMTPLLDPITGAALPILSHSSSGNQASLAEKIYFRESVVLPEITKTPTLTPTITPTPYPPGCGPPTFTEAKVLAAGCLGSTGTVSAPYSFSTAPNQLLVIRINTTSTNVPSSVKFGGATMTLWAASNVGASDTLNMYTYYLASPPTTGPLVVTVANANCGWNIASELYQNVDVSNPVGGSTVKVGGNAGGSTPFPYNFSFTTAGPASLISVFMTSDQAAGSPAVPVASPPALSFADMNLKTAGPASVDGGGSEGVEGSYFAVGPAGTYTLNFNGTQGGRWWDAQPMEIRGSSCGTPSFTPTNTPVPVPTDTNTVGPSPTFTVTPSATPTKTTSPTSSSTNTVAPSFTSTVTPTFTSTITDTNTPGPSPTSSSTNTLGPSPTFTATSSASPTITDTNTPGPSFTDTPTRTVTPTYSETFTPGPPIPNHVKITIYNSAGEIVRQLFDGAAQYQPGDLKFDKDVVLGGLQSLAILFPGYLVDQNGVVLNGLSWATNNNTGQQVKGGVYTVKAEIQDNFGQITTLQHSVEVITATPANKLTIYNSAGEIVAVLPLPSGGTGRFGSLRLSTDKLGVKVDPDTGAIQSSPLIIWLTDEKGIEYPAQWDGRNSQGLPVSSGTYMAELVYGSSGSARQAVSSKSFVVLQGGPVASLEGAFAYPNPVEKGGDILVSYKPSPGSVAVARLYNLTGALVSQADDAAQTGTLRFAGKALAGGIYFVKLEKVIGSASLVRTTLKVAVIH